MDSLEHAVGLHDTRAEAEQHAAELRAQGRQAAVGALVGDKYAVYETVGAMDSLERANATLAARDLYLMQQNNGRYAVFRIERGQAYGGYDRYVRVGRSHSTVDAALQAVRMVTPCRG
jgi:hypothetical protein